MNCETQRVPLKSGGHKLLCVTEECDNEHNEIDIDEMHCYGCDCYECLTFYRSLK